MLVADVRCMCTLQLRAVLPCLPLGCGHAASWFYIRGCWSWGWPPVEDCTRTRPRLRAVGAAAVLLERVSDAAARHGYQTYAPVRHSIVVCRCLYSLPFTACTASANSFTACRFARKRVPCSEPGANMILSSTRLSGAVSAQASRPGIAPRHRAVPTGLPRAPGMQHTIAGWSVDLQR